MNSVIKLEEAMTLAGIFFRIVTFTLDPLTPK